jgi:hypothetical protein
MIAEEAVPTVTENKLLNRAVAALNNPYNLDLINFVDKVTEYCIENENGKVFDGWPRESLRQLIAYHQFKGTLIVLSDNDKNVVGVFMWYNCDLDDNWQFVYNWEEDDKNGNAIFLAFLFASSTAAWKRLAISFIEKEPDCLHKRLLGSRHRKGQPTKVYYTQKILTRILKLKD